MLGFSAAPGLASVLLIIGVIPILGWIAAGARVLRTDLILPDLIELVMSGTQLGRPLSTNAGVPPERVAALRAAFAATMKDPDFLADAKSLNFEVDPVLGERMQQIVQKVLATPPPIAARAKVLLE